MSKGTPVNESRPRQRPRRREREGDGDYYHVVSWAPDGSRTWHLVTRTLDGALEAVRDMADGPEERLSDEDGWVGETVRVRGFSGCRPWVQILVGGRRDTPEEHLQHLAHTLRGVQTEGEARAVVNQGPVPTARPPRGEGRDDG